MAADVPSGIVTGSNRRLAAIMFTDIAGFTQAAQVDEAQALRMLSEHNRLTRQVLREYEGREVKTIGDSFLVEFSSALQAVGCAIAIQQAIHERNSKLPEKEKIGLRIGVHLGDVVGDGSDILGDAVNVSSRIQSLAEPGGICISQQVYDQIGNKINANFELIKNAPLKNVNQQINVYRLAVSQEKRGAEIIEPDRHRVAVLPLQNMSPDPNDEYFADGMTEELITVLSGVRELTVIARTSIMQYKSSPKRASEIGRDLLVGTLIEGSVRKAANKVRIAVQLIDASSEGHLWAQSYDRTMDDIFAIQSEIAEKVADALRIRLIGSEKKKLETKRTESVEAFTLYLKGRHFWNERSQSGLMKAIGYFEEAVKRDPRFALGYAGLADCYFVLHSNSTAKVEGGYMKSTEFVLKALTLDSDLAEAHATLAALLFYDQHDFEKSETQFRKAIEINPNYATAHQWFAHLLASMTRIPEAMREIRKALELDPLSPIINCNVGDGKYYSGVAKVALEYYTRALEVAPGFGPAYSSQIQPLCYLKMFAEAQSCANELEKLGNPLQAKLYRAYIFAHMGEFEKSRKLLAELEEENTNGSVPMYHLALAYFVLGDIDRAFSFMQKSNDNREYDVLNMKIDRELDRVRSDSRYIDLIKRLGFE